jgi:dCTP deaminase
VSILVGPQIQSLANAENLIHPFDGAFLQGASYDARLGYQYKKGGKISTLSESAPSLSLYPGEFAILQSLEELKLPIDIVGHNGVASRWTRLGLVCLFSPQIDPGFEGYLMVPVFNAGDAEIILNLKDDMFTLEFSQLSRPAQFLWSDVNRKRTGLGQISASPIQSKPNFHDLMRVKEEVEEASENTRQLRTAVDRLQERVESFERRLSEQAQYRGIIATLLLAGIAIIIALVTFIWTAYPPVKPAVSNNVVHSDTATSSHPVMSKPTHPEKRSGGK